LARSKSIGKLSRRRDQRLRHMPLTVELEDAFYTTVDWSLGGFRIAGYDGKLAVDNDARVMVTGEIAGKLMGGSARVKVVRLGPEPGELAAAFVELHDDTWDHLEQLSLRRLRLRPAR
jgi:hypothetical protein